MNRDRKGAVILNAYALFGILAATLSIGIGVAIQRAIGVETAWAWLIGVNVSAAAAYAYDKNAARGDKLRVPEMILHLLALSGGSPAALIAQRVLRHKTVKTRFQVVFWLIVAIQIAAVVLCLRSRYGG